MEEASFRVQQKMCRTCIYHPDNPLDLAELEARIADPHGGFSGYRVCHHTEDVCCRGFWDRHKDEFVLGQIAQRLNVVEFIDVDNMRRIEEDGTQQKREDSQ